MNERNILLFFEILLGFTTLSFLGTLFTLLKLIKKLDQLAFVVKNMIVNQSLKKDFDMEGDLNNRLSLLQKSKFSPMSRFTTK